MRRLRALTQSFGAVPGVIVSLFAILGIVIVELDRTLEVGGTQFVFQGDGSAARTVLSVIAGSLITVAGLVFSITMVALQLTSSQFSPRVLRTFFADRITQLTIGVYVGTFVYALLVLRSVGSFGDSGFVPRVSVTVASVLGIAAVVLLIVFLQHVAKLIQVSHIMGSIAHDTLRRLDALYPERYGEAAGEETLEGWREEPSGIVRPYEPGYVRAIELERLAERVAGEAERVAILVCPGDFAGVETALAEVWPAEASTACREPVRAAIAVHRERDLDQDIDFGLRQLTDTALKALSAGINDPATAVTCIGYVRSILVNLTERAFGPPFREFPGQGVMIHARRRSFDEYLAVLLQLNRCVDGDAWVAGELLRTVEVCAATASRCGAWDRVPPLLAIGETIGEQAAREAGNEPDREAVANALAAVRDAAREPLSGAR
jgi:uncharacterized membrane protein